MTTHYKGTLDWLDARTVLYCRTGGQAYGTSSGIADDEYKGVAIPPAEYFFGFAKTFEKAETKSRVDCVIFDIRRFFSLASDCNPTALELLWADPEDCLHVSALGERLVASRELFLSKRAKFTFTGHALSQLKRMQQLRRWMVDPPHQPEIDAGPASRREWDQYLEWKHSRNSKKAARDARFGYDTNFAMHVVRLLRMCEEILASAMVVVRRPDFEELLAIRDGQWKYEEVMVWAEEQERALDTMYERSTLPVSPDRTQLDALCVELVQESFR